MRGRNSDRCGNSNLLMPLLVIGLILSIPNFALATPFQVTSVGYQNTARVTIGGLVTNGGVYTEYELHTDLFGTLDAFCVEGVAAPTRFPQAYELLVVPDNLSVAAWVAEQYWTGNTAGFAKEDYQIAIWELVFDSAAGSDLDDGNFRYHSGADRDNIEAILGWDFGIPSSMVSLAHNPVGDYTRSGYQDYLVTNPVPEPGTVFLFGAGLIAMAVVGRKKLGGSSRK